MKFLKEKKDIIKKVYKNSIFVILCLFIFISFILTFFFFTDTERGRVLRNIPDKIKDPIKALYFKGFKGLMIDIGDLPYIIYVFKNNNLPEYRIEIDKEDWDFLNNNLPDKKKSERYVLADQNKVYKPAKFSFNGQEYNVKVRYRGGLPDHWENEKKSWRVKFDSENLFNGQKSINLIIISGRHFYIDALNNYRAEKLGLTVAKSTYVRLYVNGKDFGPYYVFEQWGDELLEKNQLVGDTNQYGEKEAGDQIFKNLYLWRKYVEDALHGYDNYAEIEKLIGLLNLEKVSDNEFWKKISNFIDMEKYYAWQIQAAIAGSVHQNFTHNIQLYFDNTTGKFFPLPDDVSRDDIEGRIIPLNDEQYSIDFINMNPLNTRILKNPSFLNERNKLLWDYVKDNKNLEDDLAYFDKLYNETKYAVYNDRTKAYSNSYFENYVGYMRSLTEANFKYLKKLFSIYDIEHKSEIKNNKVILDISMKNFSPVYLSKIDLEKNNLNWRVYYDKNNNTLLDYNDTLLGSIDYKTGAFSQKNKVDFDTEREWEINTYSRIQEGDLKETKYKLILVPQLAGSLNIYKINLEFTDSITGNKVTSKEI